MHELFERYRAWIAQHCPHYLPALNRGAKTAAFQRLEQRLGLALPNDFKTFYECANGEQGQTAYLLYSEEWMPLERIAQEWTLWTEMTQEGTFVETDGTPKRSRPDEGVKDDWWNPRWVPFTSDGGGDHYCLDMDPAEGGMVGQVIRMCHDGAARQLIAPFFTVFISDWVRALERGEYQYSPNDEAILHHSQC